MKTNTDSTTRAPWLALAVMILTSASFATAQSNQPPVDKEYEAGATLWQQSSGEYRALAYQAFALARMRLDQDLRNHRIHQRRAVIVDLDETILDNSRYEAMIVNQHRGYPDGWADWVNRAEAAAVPGAVEFLKYANSRGVRVFYVTNREPNLKAATTENLKKLGFPEVTEDTFRGSLTTESESKETRRLAIMAKYRVVLLMGDDLNDFAKVFEDSKTVESRLAAAERFKAEFGKRFIVLPNAMYGNWELSIYGYKRMTQAEKAEVRRKLLKAN